MAEIQFQADDITGMFGPVVDDLRAMVRQELDRAKQRPEMQPAPLIVDARRLAEILSVSLSWVERRAAAGTIPSLHGGGKTRRFLVDDVIAKMRTGSPADQKKAEASTNEKGAGTV
ncbi:hypothetical protein LF1_18630 [Rubripirellula obstinata]|uniref:Helix-turn-helix domain protein n=1 Tax=Rubripirellula obstinata TaxID=406547 RepID=A0A5B1CGJ5_9BACT|nr:DNA-binding protein [Rubripirellula obstinata]KAA1259331.1 hypothetical protein LF1_18630 [Rubripirellula obstinata]